MHRRPARSQVLPPGEVELLRRLDGPALHQRTVELYSAGWTLRSVGEALTPPRRRSTVASWVDCPHPAASLSDRVPVPAPEYRTSPGGYVRRTPASPGLREADRRRIADLAPLARSHRARTRSDAPAAVANAELTELCRRLRASHVTVTELARAAGVTYRAMARRVGDTTE
jgi:hypothetical protein